MILTRLNHRFPLATRFAILALLVAAGAFWGVSSWIGDTLPPVRNTVFADGSMSPVFIERDENGVPHIYARTDDDAFFALGFAQAQDRLWQLEVERRTVHGELSDLLGPGTLRQDIWFRSIDLAASARSAWPALSAPAQRSLQRFVDGINASIEARRRAGIQLPLEFKLLGIEPRPWTVFDSLARFKWFALEFSGSFALDLTREAARQQLPAAHASMLFPGVDLRPGAAAMGAGSASIGPVGWRLDADAPSWRLPKDELPPWGASMPRSGNAWAVAGRHVEGGTALLATDPHGALQMPSPWYAVQVRGSPLAVSGMSLVGVPLVIFGRNQRIAWGGAALMADTEDLYFENVDTDGGASYEASGQWHPFATRDGVITVRSERSDSLLATRQRNFPLRWRATRNGPLISDQFGAFDRPFSLRWVGFDPRDTSYEAFYRLQYATDWPAFRAAMALHVTPALNLVYADVDGHIGSLVAGRIPIRAGGQGAVPMPGWDKRFEWKGYIPVDQLPAVFDPPSGHVVAANQTPADGTFASRLGADRLSPARADRIARLLDERIVDGRPMTLDDMRRFQGDAVDGDAAALAAELVRRARPRSEASVAALRDLEGWNGAMTTDSRPALIFSVWTHHLRLALLEDGTQRLAAVRSGQSSLLQAATQFIGTGVLRQSIADCGTAWRGDAPIGCEELLSSTLGTALDDIARIIGSRDAKDWRLDAMQQGVHRPASLGRWQAFSGLFERRSVRGGSPEAIDTTTNVFVGRQGLAQTSGAGFRQIIRMGRAAGQGTGKARTGIEHLFILSTGQSGDPASPHYADMVAPMDRGEYVRLADDEAAPAATFGAGGRREDAR